MTLAPVCTAILRAKASRKHGQILSLSIAFLRRHFASLNASVNASLESKFLVSDYWIFATGNVETGKCRSTSSSNTSTRCQCYKTFFFVNCRFDPSLMFVKSAPFWCSTRAGSGHTWKCRHILKAFARDKQSSWICFFVDKLECLSLASFFSIVLCLKVKRKPTRVDHYASAALWDSLLALLPTLG